jgi:uncharacterized membrane protein
MSPIKRIALGIGVIIIGIFLWIGPEEYFASFMVVLSGILISLNVKNTWDNKLLCYGLGICALTGVILSFFFPILLGPPLSCEALTRSSLFVGRAIFTIFGIFLIFRGLKG